MKYIKTFNSMTDANGYCILDIPFACTVENGTNNPQKLYTNSEGKIIKVIDDVAYIVNIVKPLSLSFKSHGQTTISLTNNGGNVPDIKYSLDGRTWIQWDYSAISLSDEDIIYFNGNNSTGFSSSSSIYSQFVFGGTGTISASGNIMSLLDDGNCVLTSIPNNYCFYRLFQNCTSLTTTPELPATTLASYCYEYMFSGCTSLTSAPELPATTLADYCYDNMFSGCTSLTVSSNLPATILAVCCYWGMFGGCTSLTNAPKELPATTLASRCYYYMFYNCSSLTSAPELPATTLPSYCYYHMFQGCFRLSYIKCLATIGIGKSGSTSSWVDGVASSGTFIKDANATWPIDGGGIPSGWTVQTA